MENVEIASSKRGRPSDFLVGNKRSWPADSDEIVLDNVRSNKRYLTQVMASGLSGLRMVEGATPLPFFMDTSGSPAHTTDTFSGSARSASPLKSLGDEMSTLDSAPSDDSDDSVGWRAPSRRSPSDHTSWAWPPPSAARPCSISYPRGVGVGVPSTPRHLIEAMEGRLPPSPSDPNQAGANLRRSALLRAIQMRTQPSACKGGGGVTQSTCSGLGPHESAPGPKATVRDAIRDAMPPPPTSPPLSRLPLFLLPALRPEPTKEAQILAMYQSPPLLPPPPADWAAAPLIEGRGESKRALLTNWVSPQKDAGLNMPTLSKRIARSSEGGGVEWSGSSFSYPPPPSDFPTSSKGETCSDEVVWREGSTRGGVGVEETEKEVKRVG